MRRQEFMAGLGSAAGWPFTARAQQRPIPTIGFLAPGSSGVGIHPADYGRRSALNHYRPILGIFG
jgi:hypothetical protein